MLKEFSGLDRHSRWSETKKKLESDARYKAIESSSRREDWFRDYTKRLDDVSTNNNYNSIYLYGAISPELKFCSESLVTTLPRLFLCILL